MKRRCTLAFALVLVLICSLPSATTANLHSATEAAISPGIDSSLPRGDLARPSPTLAGLPAIPPEGRAKIDPELLEQLLQRERPTQAQAGAGPSALSANPVTYLVHLRQRASLRGLAAMPQLQERRELLVDRLQSTASRSQTEVIALLEEKMREGRVVRYKSYWIFNGLAVSGDLSTAIALALRPEVEAIRPNRVHRLPNPGGGVPSATLSAAGDVEWNIAKIGADRVWQDLGITGEGIVVANMDIGVDWTHPALQRKYRGYNPPPGASDHNYNWFDATGTYPDQPGPRESPSGMYDISDHGTHVMGIMVGSDPDSGEWIGVAPGAQWIAVKVFKVVDDGQDAIAEDEWIHAGFQWCLAPTDLNGKNPDSSKAPDIVNNSWGDPNGLDETFRQDIDAMRAAGIFCTYAAGNYQPSPAPPGTVYSPGSYPNSFAVGATDWGDEIAGFSCRGPSPWDEQLKPEVVAPGVQIRSSIAGGLYEGGWDGTSMAAPHVAGLAALMWQGGRRNIPPLTITATEQMITSTAVDLGELGPDNTYGHGRIDAYQAVQAVPHYWLAASSMSAQPGSMCSADAVTYTLLLVNRQSTAVDQASLVNPLPQALAYITRTLTGADATYDEGPRSIFWQGPLPPYPQAVAITYQAVATCGGTEEIAVVNTATLSTDEEKVMSLSAEVLVSPQVTFWPLFCKNAPMALPTVPSPAGSQ